MAFFDKINSIAKNVGDKTGDAIEMAKINARIASERSAMNDIYRQLGEAYYAHRINGGEGEPVEAAAMYSQLDQHTAAIDEAQKQIVAIKAEGERRAAEAAAAEEAASAVKTQTSVQPGIPVFNTGMPAQEQRVECPQCGAGLNADVRFCSQCGAKIEPPAPEAAEAPQSRVCPGCGAEVAQGMKFCSQCGAKVE